MVFWIILAAAGVLLIVVGVILFAIPLASAPPHPPEVQNLVAQKQSTSPIDVIAGIIDKAWRVLFGDGTTPAKQRLAGGAFLIAVGVLILIVGAAGVAATSGSSSSSSTPTASATAT